MRKKNERMIWKEAHAWKLFLGFWPIGTLAQAGK